MFISYFIDYWRLPMCPYRNWNGFVIYWLVIKSIFRDLIKSIFSSQILSSLTGDKYGKLISDNVYHLNRIGLYSVSLGLIEYFKDHFTAPTVSSNLLISFNSLDCVSLIPFVLASSIYCFQPIKLYKYALVLLLDHAGIQKNLFYTMEYGETAICFVCAWFISFVIM